MCLWEGENLMPANKLFDVVGGRIPLSDKDTFRTALHNFLETAKFWDNFLP